MSPTPSLDSDDDPTIARPDRSVDFDQSGGALAAANAHRHDAPPGAATLTFEQDMTGAAAASHAERMTDGDGSPVDVVLLGVDAEGVATVEALAGKSLVQLPQVDVVDREAVTLQQARDGND